MTELAIQTYVRYKTTTCITCGCSIALVTDQYDHLLKTHQPYYCPNGHSQHFLGESEEARLQRQLDETTRRLAFERSRADQLQRSTEQLQRAAVRVKRRAAAGVCPCCHRTVAQMARHMKTKHPDFVAQP